MCGIFGVWNFNQRPLDWPAIQRATSNLRHRGPDDEGYLLVNVETGQIETCQESTMIPTLRLPDVGQVERAGYDLAFGFRRLAIIDPTPAGHQPMSTADQTLWIIFNGEIYNYLELRAELSRKGYQFRTGTDTEAILYAYQEWGVDCLARFNGMWAFAIWSQVKKELFLARDRFGIKPLYYHYDQDKLCFASEIKALVGYQDICFDPNEAMIYRYLAGGMLPNPRESQTFFKGIQALPAGHRLQVRANCIEQKRYWTLPPAVDTPVKVSVESLIDEYRDLFTDSIRLRLRADVPIGSCLSGGIDSSSIVCLVNQLVRQENIAAEHIGQRQKTFSAVYDTIGPYNEKNHVETVLKATNADGNFVYPDAERLYQDLERLVWHQDEPFLSTSIFAQWCVMQAAQERGIKVLLDGQGADEALAGYRPFAQYLGQWLRRWQFPQAIREAQAIHGITGTPIQKMLGRAILHQLPVAWVKMAWRQYARRRVDLLDLNPAFVKRQNSVTYVDWINWAEFRRMESYPYYLLEEGSLPELLRYEDRNSMAFSVEARVPFLDYRLVEFTLTKAAAWQIHQGWTKWILRQAMKDVVPDAIIWRRDKVGFETPQAIWLKQWLQNNPNLFGQQALSGQYLNLETIRKKVIGLMNSSREDSSLWRWINLEVWLQVWSKAG